MSVAVDFTTIPEMFVAVTDAFSRESRPALQFKGPSGYQGITYADLRLRVEHFALGLTSLGLKPGERVAIVSENRPEWVIADMGIAAMDAVDVPVYPTMTARQNLYIFNDAGVRFAIVSNQFQLNKIMRVIEEMKTLEKVIVMSDKGLAPDERVIPFSKVLTMGERARAESPDFFPASVKMVKPDHLLTLIYTSGTTGNPKGVMLTHHNLVSNIKSAASVIPIGPDDTMLSFLPLSHSFERMAGYYTAFACGASIAYAESVETVRDNMLEIRPTIVTTVPRLFERIYSRIAKQVDSSPPIRQKIFSWAVGVGREYAQALKQGTPSPGLRAKRAAADRLVYGKLRARTGGKMKFFVSGGAALGRQFGEFFEAVGLTIIEGYGLTESAPVISANRVDNYKFGSVGQPIPGVEVKIAHDGEILARGPNIMKGYWNDKSATREVLDSAGWLHTGDIGVLDAEGFLYITDRKKHLFVSSGGKNIAPQHIESLFMSIKYIEQFVLIGDRRMFLTALIVPDFDALKEYADSHSIPYSNESDLTKRPQITELIEKEIQGIQKDLANYERVRKFTILDKQFTIENGELTPTLKVRRNVIEERYGNLIEEMYRGV